MIKTPKLLNGTMRHPKHPIWSLIRLAILMITLYGILRIFAQNFDITEWRTIMAMFLAAAGVEGVSTALANTLKSD